MYFDEGIVRSNRSSHQCKKTITTTTTTNNNMQKILTQAKAQEIGISVGLKYQLTKYRQ